tara:strand:+ start:738 stop:866 length:129 start_codon:yes stop_codon:yes gene_type:complete
MVESLLTLIAVIFIQYILIIIGLNKIYNLKRKIEIYKNRLDA